jgi:hypothetical protein
VLPPDLGSLLNVSWDVLLLALAVGAVTGVLSGLLGVGGGIVFVPAAVILFGVSQHDAQAVSLVVIVPISIVGAISHLRLGNIRWDTVAILAPTAAIGALVGALVAQQLSNEALRVIFGLLLIYVAQRYLGVQDWLMARLRPARAD